MEQLSSNIGQLFTSNTGCLYQTRDYFNGYTILKISENQINVCAREYYHSRNEFDVSTRFSENGMKIFNLNSKKKSSFQITTNLIDNINRRANKKLLSANSNIAPQEVNNIFVEPPLAYCEEKEFYFNKEHLKNNKDAKHITLNDLKNSDDNIIFLGKRESGKTTLLNYLIVEKFNEIFPETALGIIIDLKNARTREKNLTANTLLNEALTFLDGEINKQELRDLLIFGRIVVAFDNLDTNSSNDIRTLKQFMSTYPNSRYIAVSLENQSTIKTIKLDIDIFPKQVFIHSFKKKQTESLVCKWFANDIDTRVCSHLMYIFHSSHLFN